MITPSALNLIIVGLMVMIFSFMLRMLAARLSERGSAFGDALAVVL